MKIFMIAGESSGDAIGARLISSLKEQADQPLELLGIGGPRMEEAGLDVLLPMDQLSVIGLWEIIPQLLRLYKIYKAILEEIEKQDPDIVVTIDFPDFNFFIGKALKKRGKTKAKLIHYVAPTVWAWRKGRAKKVAEFLDGMICLFPFEPEYFEKHKLKSVFTGHPLIEENILAGDGQKFRQLKQIPEGKKTIGMFFGSRPEELKRMGKIMLETAEMIKERHPDIHIIIPTLPHLEYDIYSLLQGSDFAAHVVSEKELKWDAFAACDAAICVSGTVALELAYAGIPHVLIYNMSYFTWFLLHFLLKVRNAHLANIMLEKTVVPEYLQSKCNPEEISKGAIALFENPKAVAFQKKGFKKVRQLLRGDRDEKPTAIAAAFILESVKS